MENLIIAGVPRGKRRPELASQGIATLRRGQSRVKPRADFASAERRSRGALLGETLIGKAEAWSLRRSRYALTPALPAVAPAQTCRGGARIPVTGACGVADMGFA